VINAVVRQLPEGFLAPKEFGDSGDGASPEDVAVDIGHAGAGAHMHFRARRSSSVEQVAAHTVAGDVADAKKAEALGAQHQSEIRRTLSQRSES
jgi:hypothetical protein